MKKAGLNGESRDIIKRAGAGRARGKLRILNRETKSRGELCRDLKPPRLARLLSQLRGFQPLPFPGVNYSTENGGIPCSLDGLNINCGRAAFRFNPRDTNYSLLFHESPDFPGFLFRRLNARRIFYIIRATLHFVL